MLPSPCWTRRSTGLIICARLFPRYGNSLVHVARLIDQYVIESLDERVLAEACEAGASPRDLDFLLSRTVPDWRKVVVSAAKGGHLHVFQWMTERQDSRGPWGADFYNAIGEAARCGHLEIVKWLHERGLSCIGRNALVDVARHGHFALLKWLLEHTTDTTSGVDEGIRYAAARGHRVTVQWIYENFKETIHMAPAMAGAARNGDLDMLQWLHQQKSCSEACSTDTMDAAASYGYFRVVEWLFENCNKSCSTYAARGAARAGDLPMLQWLHENSNDRFDSGVLDSAASEGHLETVKWLHEHRSEGCTSHAMDDAASNGHLDVVRWLHHNRTEGCTTDAMDGAAEGGHLDIVKWLHENRSEGCTEAATYEASHNGHMDVLRWLVEQFPDKCRDDLMEVAAWEGHLDVVQYLGENTIQRGSAWGLDAAAKKGWMQALLVLIQNYFHDDGKVDWCRLDAVGKAFDKILAQLSSRLTTAVASLWSETLRRLESFRSCGFFSCVSEMLERALRRGYLRLVQQFMGQQDANEKSKYVEVAANSGHFVFLRWLLENGTPIGISSVVKFGADPKLGEYVEIASYLSENERVHLVCDAVTKKRLKLLQWLLEKTSFNDENARDICSAFQQAPPEYVQWLRENLSDAEARKWGVHQGVE